MKHSVFGNALGIVSLIFCSIVFVACIDDEDFSPVSRTNGHDSAYGRGDDVEQFNPSIDYGSMRDPRDGKTYRTVDIDGLTWMAENLNYAGNRLGESFCFNDDNELCEIYGRLYSRDAAMNDLACDYDRPCNLGTGPVQGVCPDGWHIPTMEETQGLIDLVNGSGRKLRSAKGWRSDTLDLATGEDVYGLSFMGAGNLGSIDGFMYLGTNAFMWTYYPSEVLYYLLIWGDDDTAFIMHWDTSKLYLSVRCVKG